MALGCAAAVLPALPRLDKPARLAAARQAHMNTGSANPTTTPPSVHAAVREPDVEPDGATVLLAGLGVDGFMARFYHANVCAVCNPAGRIINTVIPSLLPVHQRASGAPTPWLRPPRRPSYATGRGASVEPKRTTRGTLATSIGVCNWLHSSNACAESPPQGVRRWTPAPYDI